MFIFIFFFFFFSSSFRVLLSFFAFSYSYKSKLGKRPRSKLPGKVAECVCVCKLVRFDLHSRLFCNRIQTGKMRLEKQKKKKKSKHTQSLSPGDAPNSIKQPSSAFFPSSLFPGLYTSQEFFSFWLKIFSNDFLLLLHTHTHTRAIFFLFISFLYFSLPINRRL